MPGREEKHVVNRYSLAPCILGRQIGVGIFFFGPAHRRAFRFLPCAPVIGRSVYSRAKVPRANRRQNRSGAPRILHHMVNLTTKEPRLFQPPFRLATRWSPQGPTTLACSDDPCIRPFGGYRLCHAALLLLSLVVWSNDEGGTRHLLKIFLSLAARWSAHGISSHSRYSNSQSAWDAEDIV